MDGARTGTQPALRPESENVVVYVIVFLGLFFSTIALLSSLMQPSWAFKQAGHSKGIWVLLNLVSLVTIIPSYIIVPIYLFRVRPALFTRTGRTSKLDGGRQPQPANKSYSGAAEWNFHAAQPNESTAKPRGNCMACGGRRVFFRTDGSSEPCTACGGSGLSPY